MNLDQIARYAKAYKANRLAQYVHGKPGKGGMSPGQREFHKGQSQKRLLIAGNQVGKSYALAAEIWFMAGAYPHPYRQTPEVPALGWAMVADLKSGWQNLSAKLKELEPPGVVHPLTSYDNARGYTTRGQKMIRLRNGSLVIGKSGSQEMISLSGATIDFLAIDELPKQGHFGEAKARCAVHNAPIVQAFTPIGRPCTWLRDTVEGNPDTGEPATEEWEITRIALSAENAPHRDPESIESQIAAMSPWEKDQRIFGSWEGVSLDRWIPFSEEHVFEDPPENIERVALGVDHGERPGNTYWCLIGVDDLGRVWVLDEFVPQERMTPLAEARKVKAMVESWGLSLWQIDECRGDSNSLGRLGLGATVNQGLEVAFAELVNSKRPPFRIEVPWKGPGSIRARARVLANACISGSFRVNKKCNTLISSLRHWHGKNDNYKHAYDGCVYIAEHYLSQQTNGVGHLVIT